MKRLFDILVSAILLVLLSPLLLAVGIAIRLESSGPALFRQRRVGLHGDPFTIYKFRSMVVSQAADASYNTRPGDSRITRVGSFIRATSIDELPQLLNVLKGDMSIVGPRPDLEIQQKDYRPEDWELRHSVRPGVTGLAQVNGRSNIGQAERLRHDLAYAASPGMLRDLSILLKTVKLLLSGRDAN